MDARILYTINVLFIVAVVVPPLLVVLYRWREVPLRRAEIDDMMKAAFGSGDEASRKATQDALDSNPYISNPTLTFERYHNPWRYVVPVLVLIVITASSAYIGYSWVRNRVVSSVKASTAAAAASTSPATTASGGTPPSSTPASSSTPAPQNNSEKDPPIPVIIMALAGGYVWSVYQIFSRARASELSPADLYEIDLGMLVAVPVGLAFSLITSELGGVRSFMAFAASAFPLRDVSRMVRQYSTRKMLDTSDASAARPAERHLGTAIEGLSDQTLARLGELRITTVLDIAYCDPIKVMVQTGFPLPVIVDWMDQSIWALYAGDLKAEINKCGIRCSLDVCEFVDMHLRTDKGEKKSVIEGPSKEALDALAQKMGCQATLLQDLFFRIYADPQVVILRRLWYPKGVPKDLLA